MTRRRKKSKKPIIIALIALLIVFVSIPGFVYMRLHQRLDKDSSVLINIERNQSVDKIIDELNENGILTPAFIMKPALKIYIKLSHRKVYAGSYKFAPESKHIDVFNAIIRGEQNNMVKVTFPEGMTVRQFAKIISKNLNIGEEKFIEIANADSIIKAKNIPINNIEGYLYPATYTFAANQSAEDVLFTLLDEQDKLWNNANFKSRLEQTGKSKHEILTLASIIEAETPVIEERRRIAGVYVNRLNQNMRLEADPTVQYATGEKRRITYADLDVNHKYNTYRNYGLPPGPINNPSKESIDAAMNPESHNFLFFVAVGDGSGRHNFSTNFTQHKRYVGEYRRNRRQ